jgi:thiol-disulfide isomerase/thioredoxin
MTGRRIVPRVAAVLAAAAALALSACTSSGTGSTYQFSSATALGTVIPVADRKPAPAVSGQLLDASGSVNIHRFRGAITVLNFWASWCAPCKSETPQLVAAYRDMHPHGVAFLGVDTKDLRMQAKAFVALDKVPYPIVYDQQGQVQLQLGNIPGRLPFTVLLDERGRVAAVYLSPLTEKDLQTAIGKLRAESPGHVG